MFTYSFDKLYRVRFTNLFRLVPLLERINNTPNKKQTCTEHGFTDPMPTAVNFHIKYFKYLGQPANVGICGCWMANETDDRFARLAE